MLGTPCFSLPGLIVAAGEVIGKIGKLNTKNCILEIGAGEVVRQEIES
jgi:hypothetical protein